MRPIRWKRSSDFIADFSAVSVPGCFRIDNRGEFKSSDFTEFCNYAKNGREYTSPVTQQQNVVTENAIWNAIKAGHAAWLEAPRLSPTAESRLSRPSFGAWIVCRRKPLCGRQSFSYYCA